MMKKITLSLLFTGLFASAFAQNEGAYFKIRNNSFFYKDQKAIRVRDHEPKGPFYLLSEKNDTVYKGEMKLMLKRVGSSKMVTKCNFTDFEKAGVYKLYVPAIKKNQPEIIITTVNDEIRLNQVGFYPNSPKIGVIAEAPLTHFFVINATSGDTVFSGPLQKPMIYKHAGEMVRRFNFSRLKSTGKFKVAIPDLGTSQVFEIKNGVHRDVTKSAIKAFYYNRCSFELKEKWAGKWKRPAGHMDDSCVIHPAAASDGRPAGTVIKSPGGWYDAGDYGKYSVNSGISTYTMLIAYEHYPEYYKSLKVDIPENGNAIPDILDETLYNLRWMMTMQDPADGGVYHKLSTAGFAGDIMPHKGNKIRYLSPKSTSGTLDFAAVMATGYRVFKNFKKELPGLADSCLAAAKKAYKWAEENNDVQFSNEAINAKYDIKITTGGYGDSKFNDEFYWAAVELFLATNDEDYSDLVTASGSFGVPSWATVNTLGLISLAHNDNGVQDEARKQIISLSDNFVTAQQSHPYKVVMGKEDYDFVWGSNSVAANQGIILMQAYRYTGEKKYLDAAHANLDYLLGRNATGYCFVTGAGGKSPMHIHHRQSQADKIKEPVPGFLAGGPQNGKQDHCKYKKSDPANCYSDSHCSYSTNEIAINWNAPFVYLSGAVDASRSK